MSGPALGVSCALMMPLLRGAMRAAATRGVRRFLLDGFPRSLEQVAAFERLWGPPSGVLHLACDEDTMRARVLARGGGGGRGDDNAVRYPLQFRVYGALTRCRVQETFEKRMVTYKAVSVPVLQHYYVDTGRVWRVDARPASDIVYSVVRGFFAPDSATLTAAAFSGSPAVGATPPGGASGPAASTGAVAGDAAVTPAAGGAAVTTAAASATAVAAPASGATAAAAAPPAPPALADEALAASPSYRAWACDACATPNSVAVGVACVACGAPRRWQCRHCSVADNAAVPAGSATLVARSSRELAVACHVCHKRVVVACPECACEQGVAAARARADAREH